VTAPRTIVDKIWDAHLVGKDPLGRDLLYIDMHLMHEVTSPQGFDGLRLSGRRLRRPDLSFAVIDHVIPTCDRKGPWKDEMADRMAEALEKNCRESRITLFGIDDERQGVIHVVAPEQGLVQPGMTIVCGDSHTSTHGAFGTLAFGIGTSEVEHVMATQTLPWKKPKSMAVEMKGRPSRGVTSKDMALEMIRTIGVNGGAGCSIEFQGKAVKDLGMESRMTLCNMAIEAGARSGIVAPDKTTFKYLKKRTFAPSGADWDKAVKAWRELVSDTGAVYEKRVVIDTRSLEPLATWGTTPGQCAAISGKIPDPDDEPDARNRAQMKRALEYMGLKAGMPLEDVKIDCVFIGSCTNGRIEDLRCAARVLKGRRVAGHVRALAVPGSGLVKKQAEKEGLDEIFKEAGFEWREPGCSMCLAMNPDVLGPGERSASTSNRNFEGRQGRGARTHLVSPYTAAASAISGRLADPREYL